MRVAPRRGRVPEWTSLSPARRKTTEGGRARPAEPKRAGRRPRAGSAAWAAEAVLALDGAPFGVAVLDERLLVVRVNGALAAQACLSAGPRPPTPIEEALPGVPPDLALAARRVKHGEAPGAPVPWTVATCVAPRHLELVPWAFGGTVVLVANEAGPLGAAGRLRADRDERFARIVEVSAAFSAAATEQEVVAAAFHIGVSVLGASGGSLSFPGEDGALEVAHAFGSMARRGGSPAPQPKSLAAPSAECFSRGAPVWIGSAAELARRYPALAPAGVAVTDASWAAVPLVVRERTLGVLGLGFAGAQPFGEDERDFIVALAQECAQALERSRLYEAQRRERALAVRVAEERDELVKELRRTLRERDESMALLDALFENAPVGLALFDRDMRYVRVNAHLGALTGVPPAQHVGRQVWDVMPLMVREELVHDFQSVLEHRKPVVEHLIAAQLRNPVDPLRSFLVSFYPVTVGDRLIGVGCLVREVTDARRAEQAQRHLLGVVGHDLRSPLMAITASAELLQSVALGEREQRSVGRILRASQRIDGIIRALVDFTLVHVGGGIPLQRRRTELGSIARTVAEEAEAAHPGRRVRVAPCEAIPGEWDPDRVGQALANLVGNAIHYSPEESAVEVTCRLEGDDGVVEVTNQGPPIAPELLPYLFEPFRRGADNRTQRRKGLGLGLYIARQLVGAHGGAMEVRTGDDRGTTFTVRLPRSPFEAEAPQGGGALTRA